MPYTCHARLLSMPNSVTQYSRSQRLAQMDIKESRTRKYVATGLLLEPLLSFPSLSLSPSPLPHPQNSDGRPTLPTSAGCGTGGPSVAAGTINRGWASTTYSTPSSDMYEGGRAVAGRGGSSSRLLLPVLLLLLLPSLPLLPLPPLPLPLLLLSVTSGIVSAVADSSLRIQ